MRINKWITLLVLLATGAARANDMPTGFTNCTPSPTNPHLCVPNQAGTRLASLYQQLVANIQQGIATDFHKAVFSVPIPDDVQIFYHVKNPDPGRIAVWDTQLTYGQLRDVAVLAAATRVWEPWCNSDYADYRTRWRALEERFTPLLEAALKKPNFYERATSLFQLLDNIDVAAAAAGIALPANHPLYNVGLRYQVMQAIVNTYRETHHGAFIKGWYQRTVSRARAWSRDDAFERDLFCSTAFDVGSHRTPQMVNLTTHLFDPTGYVKQPAWRYDPRFSQLKQLAQQRQDEADATLRLETPNVPELSSIEKRGNVVSVTAPVEAVAWSGSRAVLSLLQNDRQGFQCIGDWVKTNRPIRISESGTIEYETVCTKRRAIHAKTVVKVNVADLPRSLAPRKGDYVRIFGIVDRSDERREVTTISMNIGFLTSIFRGEDQVMSAEGPRRRVQVQAEPAQPRIN